jgi:predicted  nucleic acid-binding Zn-ribbon protein
MNGITQNLLRLQGLDFGQQPTNASQATVLRATIPQGMLQQYDRLRARGKTGIAVVRNRVCTGCRMQVPIAVVAMLMRGTGIQVCGNCGRYLCLPELSDEPALGADPNLSAAVTPAPRTRKRKAARQGIE